MWNKTEMANITDKINKDTELIERIKEILVKQTFIPEKEPKNKKIAL